MRIKLFVLAGLIVCIVGCSRNSSSQSSPVIVTNHHIATTFTVPSNPYGLSTPEECNYAVFTRYYYNPEPPQIKAILVLMPGFFGGAADFDKMAKTIVQMGKGDIEVWAVDRRSVLLNDFTGMQEAWNKRKPSIAVDYYFNEAIVNGKTYAGTPTPTSMSYMSEWGLDMTLRDLNTIISLVPQQYRKTNVFLGGHSLGAFLSQGYAAYDFGTGPTDTTNAGYNSVAGVMLLDGGGSGMLQPVTETAYFSSTGVTLTISGLEFILPSVNMLETDPAQVTAAGLLPALIRTSFLNVFTFVQIEGMYAMLEPNKESTLLQNLDFRSIAATLLGNTQFKATNQAMLGFSLDCNFNPISIMCATLGSVNGPVKSTASFLDPNMTISQPTDKGTMTYTWNSQNHITYMTDLAAALSNTYTTMTERYFPTRLLLDSLAMADYGPTQTTDWRFQNAGMRVIYTPQMDAPVIAFGGTSGAERTEEVYHLYRDTVAPARNCSGQPRTACGFDIHIMPDYTHLDVLLSDPTLSSDNVDAMIYNWIMSNTGGDMPVPVLP